MSTEKEIQELRERIAWIENNQPRDCSDEQFDDEEDEPEIDWEERRELEEAEIAGNCHCGAWQFYNGGVIHVADCCCGAE